MSRVSLRSDYCLFSLADVDFYQQEKLDTTTTKLFQLPTHRFVIERYFTISKETSRKDDGVANQVASELEDVWIYCNVYPIS